MESVPSYLGFALFVLVSITTPGPNNIMTLHSGARYGIKRTVPLVLGIQFGFALMIAIIAFGSAIILSRIEGAATLLRIVCFVYLMYLAWRIASSPPPNLDAPLEAELESGAKPIRMIEAMLFQWVNPKAWAVAVATVGTYGFLFGDTLSTMLGFAGTFLALGLPSSFAWACGGTLIGKLLRSPAHYRVFSVTAAIAMIAAVVPALLAV